MLNIPYQDKSSPWSSHSLIYRLIEKMPAHSKVLDVGTASGMLARREWARPLRFFGIEAVSEWAEIAAPFYEKIWVCAFDEASEEILGGYNAIVLADVLEHMPSPDKALKKLVGLQSSGALFAVSVPNIANFWMRLNLLFGRFDYADRGIMDRTHLRFFTRKTSRLLVENAGLDVMSIQVTPIPLELVSPFFLSRIGRMLHYIFAKLTSLFPTLLGYQIIVEAKKP